MNVFSKDIFKEDEQYKEQWKVSRQKYVAKLDVEPEEEKKRSEKWKMNNEKCQPHVVIPQVSITA